MAAGWSFSCLSPGACYVLFTSNVKHPEICRNQSSWQKNEGQKDAAIRRTRPPPGIIFLPQMFLPVFFMIALGDVGL
jgi:hypothetical protein